MKKCTQNWLVMLLVGAMLLFNSYAANANEDEMMEEGAPVYEIPPKPLLIADRLLLHNAVGAFWGDTQTREKIAHEDFEIDLENVPAAPEQVFADVVEEGYDGTWSFEGGVNRMGTRQGGIEYIAERNMFILQAKIRDDGGYRITFVEYNPIPAL